MRGAVLLYLLFGFRDFRRKHIAINIDPEKFMYLYIHTHVCTPGQGSAVSMGPIWHACIVIRPAKHRKENVCTRLVDAVQDVVLM